MIKLDKGPSGRLVGDVSGDLNPALLNQRASGAKLVSNLNAPRCLHVQLHVFHSWKARTLLLSHLKPRLTADLGLLRYQTFLCFVLLPFWSISVVNDMAMTLPRLVPIFLKGNQKSSQTNGDGISSCFGWTSKTKATESEPHRLSHKRTRAGHIRLVTVPHYRQPIQIWSSLPWLNKKALLVLICLKIPSKRLSPAIVKKPPESQEH